MTKVCTTPTCRGRPIPSDGSVLILYEYAANMIKTRSSNTSVISIQLQGVYLHRAWFGIGIVSDGRGWNEM
jgi:hypothetical protein